MPAAPPQGGEQAGAPGKRTVKDTGREHPYSLHRKTYGVSVARLERLAKRRLKQGINTKTRS